MWWQQHPDQEYAYREAGLRERQGEVPVRLVLIAAVLLAWGLLQLFAG